MLHLQKQRDRGGGVTRWGWHQGQPQSIDAASVRSVRVHLKSVWKHANTDTTPTSRLITDKDQLSGEKPVAWGTFVCEAAVFCWVRKMGMCSSGVADEGGDSLVSVGCFPQLVCGHPGWEVVVLHYVLEVEFWHHLKLTKRKKLLVQRVRGYV